MTEFYHIDVEELTTLRNGYTAVVNHYWWESEDGVLDFRQGSRRIMQANPSLDVMEYFQRRGVKPYVSHTPLLLPVAYYPRSD